jgi:hypothetical protein
MSRLAQEVAQLAQGPTEQRLLGLKRIIPKKAVQAVLKQTGHDRRCCPRLPAWFMTWFVIALGLFCPDSYRQIFRWLQPFRKKATPGRSTLCQARQRLGVAPLRRLADAVVQLLAQPKTPGAFYRHFRLMAIDGFLVDVPDTPANERIFGRPKGRTPGAFPQARIVALCETGTHVLYRWLVKPRRRGEIHLARHLLWSLERDMLLLWDRNFFSYDMVHTVLEQRTQLLARIRSNLVLRPVQALADGSYLAKIYPSAKHRRKDQEGLTVRVIEYVFTDPARAGREQKHRLLTTLLDAAIDPAHELVVLYHERWEEEGVIDEIKTHQQERPVLRSQTPAGVVQEIYGLLLGHYVVRRLMFEAAHREGYDPRRLSFTGTLKILRCRLPECPKGKVQQKRWYENLIAEIAEEVIEKRRGRSNPRVIKRKMSNWKKKRPEHRHWPQPSKEFRQSFEIVR